MKLSFLSDLLNERIPVYYKTEIFESETLVGLKEKIDGFLKELNDDYEVEHICYSIHPATFVYTALILCANDYIDWE
jgi:hypothetical protein